MNASANASFPEFGSLIRIPQFLRASSIARLLATGYRLPCSTMTARTVVEESRIVVRTTESFANPSGVTSPAVLVPITSEFGNRSLISRDSSGKSYRIAAMKITAW